MTTPGCRRSPRPRSRQFSNEDMIAFTDLMVDDAITVSIAERDGEVRYSVRSRAESRARNPQADILERGFEPGNLDLGARRHGLAAL